MNVENQYKGLAQRLELQRSSKEDDHRPPKIAYTREFLLSCAEFDNCKVLPTGFDPSVFRPSKAAYTREFLLPCAELDVRKHLPEGFDSSVVPELEDGFRGTLEQWKGSGVLLSPNSGKMGRVQFSGFDCDGNSQESVGISDYLPLRWSRTNKSQGSYYPDGDEDFGRHADLNQCLVKLSECKAEDMAKRFDEKKKNDCCQLSKSKNPYRPPHTYQGCRTKYQRTSYSMETVTEKMGSGVRGDTQVEGPRIAEGEEHDSKDTLAKNIPNCPVYGVKSVSNVINDSHTMKFDSKKTNTSTVPEDLNEEQNRMTLKEDIVSSLKVPSGRSSAVIESHEAILGMEFNELLNNKTSNYRQRGSFIQIMPGEGSELDKFPFMVSHGLVSSILHDHDPIRTNYQGITADEVMELYGIEESECSFDDMWSGVMEILQFEQEMELTPAAESNQAADYQVQISLSEEHSLISVDNLASSERSTFVSLNTNNDIAHYAEEIHLPDEKSLTTVDDLIAPEGRLISTHYPMKAEPSRSAPLKSCFGAADNVLIHLPDEGNLITIDDLIAPNHLRFIANGKPERESTWMSDVRDEVARSGALVTTEPAKGFATQILEVPSSLDVTTSKAYQELHFCQSSLHKSCNINPEMAVCHPFNYLGAQMGLQSTFMVPVPRGYYPPSYCYSCPHIVHPFPERTASSKWKDFSNPHVQYSPLLQPNNFLQQNHLPTKDRTFANLEAEKKLNFPLRQRTEYADLAMDSALLLDPIAVEGCDHQMVDLSKA